MEFTYSHLHAHLCYVCRKYSVLCLISTLCFTSYSPLNVSFQRQPAILSPKFQPPQSFYPVANSPLIPAEPPTVCNSSSVIVDHLAWILYSLFWRFAALKALHSSVSPFCDLSKEGPRLSCQKRQGSDQQIEILVRYRLA